MSSMKYYKYESIYPANHILHYPLNGILFFIVMKKKIFNEHIDLNIIISIF